jgi:hypothetical protein
MRRQIVVDQEGRILATAPHPEDHLSSGAGNPRSLGFMPLKGQKIHTVDLPAELSDGEGLRKLHKTYRIRVTNGKPTVVEGRE